MPPVYSIRGSASFAILDEWVDLLLFVQRQEMGFGAMAHLALQRAIPGYDMLHTTEEQDRLAAEISVMLWIATRLHGRANLDAFDPRGANAEKK